MANTQIRTGNGKQTETKHPCGGYISRKERRERGEHLSQAITFYNSLRSLRPLREI